MISTRKLIGLALVCGLAILLAGGIWLVRAAGRDEGAARPPLAVGAAAELGEATVTVTGHRVADGLVTIDVDVTAGGQDVADAGQGWGLITDVSQPVPPVDAGERGCAGTAVPAGTTVSCVLAFDGSGISRTPRSYVVGLTLGGESASWRLPA